jgi:hypothetical protein
MMALIAGPTSAAVETFSYDPNSPVGPANWGSLEGSFCSGMAQSGIDVPTGACNELNVDYMFQVRKWPIRATILRVRWCQESHFIVQRSYFGSPFILILTLVAFFLIVPCFHDRPETAKLRTWPLQSTTMLFVRTSPEPEQACVLHPE